MLIVTLYLGLLAYMHLKYPPCKECSTTNTILLNNNINSKVYNDEIYRLISLYPDDTHYWIKEKLDFSSADLFVQNDSLCAVIRMEFAEDFNFPGWYGGSKTTCKHTNEIDGLKFKTIKTKEETTFKIKGYSWIVD